MALKRRKTRGANQAKVLVVDPRGEDLEHTSRVLREGGLRVVSLSRLEASGPVYGVFAPDLVVLSVGASDLSALKIGQRLRHLSRGTLPILYLADSTDAALRRACLEKGRGFDALAKPADPPGAAREGERAARAQGVPLARPARRAQGADAPRPAHRGLQPPDDARGDRPGDPPRRALRGRLLGRRLRAQGLPAVPPTSSGASWPTACSSTPRWCSRRRCASRTWSRRSARSSSRSCSRARPAEQLSPLLERIAARFELARFQFDGKTVRTSIGLGQASFPDVVGTPARLLEAAALDVRRGQVISRLGTSTRLAL